MVSTLMVAALLPLPEPPPVLDCDPAVHPAAIVPAATMTPYLKRRLMPFRPNCRVVHDGRGAAGGCAPGRRLSRPGMAVAGATVCCSGWSEMTRGHLFREFC